MRSNQHTGVKASRKQTERDFEPLVTDFGTRTISDQNFSKMVALPKTALTNCGNPEKVNVKLVQEKEGKYLKLTPLETAQKGDANQ